MKNSYNPKPGDKVICEDANIGKYIATVERINPTCVTIRPEGYALSLLGKSRAIYPFTDVKQESLTSAPNASEKMNTAYLLATQAVQTAEAEIEKSGEKFSINARLNIEYAIVHELLNSNMFLDHFMMK